MFSLLWDLAIVENKGQLAPRTQPATVSTFTDKRNGGKGGRISIKGIRRRQTHYHAVLRNFITTSPQSQRLLEKNKLLDERDPFMIMQGYIIF